MSEPAPESDLREKRSALGADLIIPLLAAALAIYYLVSTRGLVWEARANGTAIGAALLTMIAVQLVRVGLRIARGRGSLGLGSLAERSPVQMQRLAMLAIIVVFIVALPWIGTTLGLFLTMGALMWTLGVRSITALLLVSLAVAGTVYVLFMVLLQSRLPSGPAEWLLDPLRAVF